MRTPSRIHGHGTRWSRARSVFLIVYLGFVLVALLYGLAAHTASTGGWSMIPYAFATAPWSILAISMLDDLGAGPWLGLGITLFGAGMNSCVLSIVLGGKFLWFIGLAKELCADPPVARGIRRQP